MSAKIIQFPKQKPLYVNHDSRKITGTYEDWSERKQRINERLEQINKLMEEMKGKRDYD